jgi:hypothetical protein
METMTKQQVVETFADLSQGDGVEVTAFMYGRVFTDYFTVKELTEKEIVMIHVHSLVPISFQFHNVRDDKYISITKLYGGNTYAN